ncbi:hypothetical protein LX32DRAFT_364156 [Colletotrichum zoysiae]|uniref:Uncharacterized protein n=1 Tax=Colletotrichum zoysiae TaxID=1216348 RepID=A0AAD9M1L2_9PEZI|nr:hypothetical protein LX32DRAFT_364156 [Colletotrichum zoysiae]
MADEITHNDSLFAIDEREASSLHGKLAPVSARIGSRLLSCPAYRGGLLSATNEKWRIGPAFLDGQVSRGKKCCNYWVACTKAGFKTCRSGGCVEKCGEEERSGVTNR